MENASRALLMAGGILLGILILSLMVTLFASSSSLSKTYNESKQSEAIQRFNTNFTQYIGKDLTIHQVVTICNFAYENNINQTIIGGITFYFPININKIKDVVEGYNSSDSATVIKYKIQIDGYSNEGYINEFSFIII